MSKKVGRREEYTVTFVVVVIMEMWVMVCQGGDE
jgi:hypothetical protein